MAAARRAERARGLTSFYFYDVETSGTHPASDRIVQFAGMRTDPALNALGEPFASDVRLAPDVVPSAEACLVTGIAPDRLEAAPDEWQVLREARQRLGEPGTCIVGYNNVRFDDDFLRHGFYRNLMDPYAHEWQDGNSRWDLIDVVRAAHALRPGGLEWPTEDGVPTFRLERLSAANGIAHGDAHDALADVRATIALARALKRAQPKLWDYALAGRSRDSAAAMLLPLGSLLAVHVSRSYPNERACIAPVVSVAAHPDIGQRVVVADLSQDVELLLEADARELRERLFAPSGEAADRPPLKVVVLNRCPFLAPINAVRQADAERLRWDFDAIRRRRRALAECADLAARVAEAYRRETEQAQADDAELALFDDFIGDGDKLACSRLQGALGRGEPWPAFDPEDPRLRVLGARLKARLRPAELDPQERAEWRAHVRQCLAGGFGRRQSLAEFRAEVAALGAGETDPRRRQTLDALAAYAPAP